MTNRRTDMQPQISNFRPYFLTIGLKIRLFPEAIFPYNTRRS